MPNTRFRFILLLALSLLLSGVDAASISDTVSNTANSDGATTSVPPHKAQSDLATDKPHSPKKSLSATLGSETVSLDVLQSLVDLQATELSMSLLDARQNRLLKGSQQWLEWEKLRYQLWTQNQAWQAIIDRDSLAMLNGNSEQYEQQALWFAKQKINAYIAQKRTAEGRQLAQQLIWQGSLDSDALKDLQSLILQSYQVDKRQDVIQAIYAVQPALHQQTDNIIDAESDNYDQIVGFIINGEHQSAEQLLAESSSLRGRKTLTLINQLYEKSQRPEQVLESARGLAMNKNLAADLRLKLWSVVAQSALKSKQLFTQRIQALEHYFALLPIEGNPYTSQVESQLFGLSPKWLWQAYLAKANQYVNEAQLLHGDDEGWLSHAKAIHKNQGEAARALWAKLALESEHEQVREQAYAALIRSWKQYQEGRRLTWHLFVKGEREWWVEQVPLAAKPFLLSQSLKLGQLRRASQLIKGQMIKPEGIDETVWQLHRARIFVLGGSYDDAANLMSSVIETAEITSRQQVDRMLQVLFDLQTVEQHEAALGLLKQLQAKSYILFDESLNRELLFWQADSYKGMNDYQQAGLLYLQSASNEQRVMDQWAQTSLYHASEMLIEAGYFDDAANQVEKLLSVTKEPARRSVLRQRLHKIRLLANRQLLQQEQ